MLALKNLDDIQAKLLAGIKQERLKVDDMLPYKKTAVLVPMVQTSEGAAILFEVRSAHLSWQPGEVCFPGGKIEADDENSCMAAVRECCEELHLTAEDVTVLGKLAPITSPLGLEVRPYLGRIHDLGKVQPNTNEVAEVFTVPLSFLLTTQPRVAKLQVATRPSPEHEFPYDLLPGHPSDWNIRNKYNLHFYKYKEHVIWGITAHILVGFLNKYKHILTS